MALLETSPSDSVTAGQSPNRSAVVKKIKYQENPPGLLMVCCAVSHSSDWGSQARNSQRGTRAAG